MTPLSQITYEHAAQIGGTLFLKTSPDWWVLTTIERKSGKVKKLEAGQVAFAFRDTGIEAPDNLHVNASLLAHDLGYYIPELSDRLK